MDGWMEQGITTVVLCLVNIYGYLEYVNVSVTPFVCKNNMRRSFAILVLDADSMNSTKVDRRCIFDLTNSPF